AGHQRLYQARRASLAAVAEFVGRRFPARVRAEWRLVLLAALVFYVPLAGTFAAAWHDPDFVYSLMAPEQVARFELMYSDEGQKKLGRLRASDDDFAMFGFYIRNNIGIGFQTFAGGVFAGLGSLFFLAANGLFIGVVGGHLVQAGHAENFFSFVAGHSALELTAIVLCGAAGLRLAARPSLEMVYGAALMLVGAAFIEAFWSSTQAIPPAVKYGVGLAGWGVLLLYFLLAGRGRAA
ncbi:MAG TPA: stage II sporulation protein M, partial [Thiotrichales bacterium]|nr:stage II sporulation protein M [Thiotrichales bacterium]